MSTSRNCWTNFVGPKSLLIGIIWHLSEITVFMVGVVNSSVLTNNQVIELADPCYGAGFSKVRAITKDGVVAPCYEYVQCIDDLTDEILSCPYHMPYFDAENQECVDHADVCFQCPKTPYALVSVPNICQQYISCVNGKPFLSACQGGLVFDGRPGVHQCNFAPNNDPVECFRENLDDLENKPCPSYHNKPIFETSDDYPAM